jgi:hypothetical protein
MVVNDVDVGGKVAERSDGEETRQLGRQGRGERL